MPSHGDNIDVLTAVAIVERLANATAVITPQGYPHPSSKSVSVLGIFDSEYLSSNDFESKQPVFDGVSEKINDFRQGDPVRIIHKNNEFEFVIKNVERETDGITRLIFRE